MCYILPQSVVFPMDYSTAIDIIPQSVAFLLQTSECGISHELS